MAFTSDRAIAPQETEEHSQTRQKASEESTLKKRRCEVEDRIDYKTVRHARRLAATRGEQPMAWEDFKKKINR